ncbi:TonB-dependent receptor [Pseudoalteromonas xiamenensis]
MSNSVSSKGKLVKLAPMLPLAVAGVVSTAHATEIKELAVSKAKAEQQQSYQATQSTNHKNTQSLAETPKTVSVITQSLMQDQGVDSLRDALRNVAGISLAAGEGGAPTGDSLSIRGFSASTDIFIDGIRDVAGYYRDTYNLEAVEVSKGPSSAQAGRGSTGGSINLATKGAKLDNFNEVSARLGSESDYRATIDSNVQINDTSAVRVNAVIDDADVSGRDFVNNSKHAIALSAATGLGTDTRFQINGEYQSQDNLPDYGLPWVPTGTDEKPLIDALKSQENSAPNVPFSNFYGSVDRDYEEIDAHSITAKFEHDLSANTTVRVQGRVGSVERESIVSAPRFKDASKSAEIRLDTQKTRDTKDSLTAIQADLLGRYFVGSIQHDLVAGVEYSKESFKRWNLVSETDNYKNDKVTIDLFNPVQVDFTGSYTRAPGSTLAEGVTKAAYVFDTITLNEQWQLTGGLRLDHFDVDYQYDYDDPSLSVSKTESELSWNAAALYKLNAESNLYFAMGNSFNPSAEGLTIRTGRGLEDLDPEETRSAEFGIKQQWFDGDLSTHVALFRVEKDNARTRELDDTYTLNGGQRVQGIEFSAMGQVNRDFNIVTSFSFQDSEVLSASEREIATVGSELARTPKFSSSVWGRYQISEKLAVGLGANYVGKRYNSADANTRKEADAYTLLNLMVTYQVNKDLGVQFNATNLTDKEYIEQLGGGHFVPGEGRYMGLSANYKF